MIDKSILDDIIVGRVEPHIYAFTTNTIPNYLKVGDTYRPVSVRLDEWKTHYPLLKKQYEGIAKVSDDVYFRDFSVHQFLETEKHRVRLLSTDIPKGTYYSKEFFKDATVDDIEEAFEDISQDYVDKTDKYKFYNAETLREETFTYARTQTFDPRPNQDKAIANFKAAVANGRTNLLMYAVMRFGKSFTSMCCAVEIKANLVLVVSAKADVRQEWKKTVESHIKFVEYDFIDSDSLNSNNHIITEKLEAGRKVVAFLTLQDLQGENIKDKHKDVFGQEIDLLLVDETHFGARADKYGEVLKQHKYEKDVKDKNADEDFIEIEEAEKALKTLSAKVTIHLSGTPYRILMGSEFKKEDIIAFCQFADIVDEQEAWDKDNQAQEEKDVKEEWENPYYGFPQMVRFAFNPNESSRKRLNELKKEGVTYAFSALFKPQSIKKDETGLHKKFKYEQEILDLLEVIDGSKEDEGLLGFLDYDKIKDGKMCRHIVIVLPYCASCDALEELIKLNSGRFKNLNEYKIINISGVENSNAYRTPKDIKKAIFDSEANGEKTITLTVNRMLTGSTVPEWDTMLYLKDTASPQEYDQAVFRLQNQYIKVYKDEEGNEIKYNMKPQTLLVDFEPSRMFVMQEKKSKIYNVNIETGGNAELESRLQKELKISPIVTLNKDKIVEVTATDILTSISNYQKDKGIKDEALELSVDLSILNDETIKAAIDLENEIGTKSGLSVIAHEGKDEKGGDDIDVPPTPPTTDEGSDTGETTTETTASTDDKKKEEISYKKKIQSFYTRILLFAFITKDRVISVSDIIDKFDTEENTRIAKNLGLRKDVLSLFNGKNNKFVLSDLDYKIQDLNGLSTDTTMTPEEKASVAVNKFGKLGDAIVITPSNICKDMVDLLPDEMFVNMVSTNGKILDIAGTAGEFAVAIYKKMLSLGISESVTANAIYTIPKSSICYELTRKLYEMLGLNVDNIATFTSFDLIAIKENDQIDYDKINNIITQNKKFSEIVLTDEVLKGDEKVNFDAIVGNPPYQEDDGGNGISARPIYNHFMEIAINSKTKYVTMITPSRWFNGGKGLDRFREKMLKDHRISKLIDFQNAKDCFESLSISGGVNYFLWDSSYDGECEVANCMNGETITKSRYLDENDEFIRYNNAVDIVRKVLNLKEKNIVDFISSRNPFGMATNERGKTKSGPSMVKLYTSVGARYIKKSSIVQGNDYFDKYKVMISRTSSEHAGEPDKMGKYRVLSTMRILKPNEVCTDTYIVAYPSDDCKNVENFYDYLRTKFSRFLILQTLSSINMTKDRYVYVPQQDFSRNWTDEALYKKYGLTNEEISFIEAMIKPME